MIRKLKLGLITWLVCSLLLVSGAVKSEEPSVKPHLVMVEKIWVPDSVYSPDRGGMDFDWTVWWWRWENGLTDKKPPYKNFDEAIAADWNFDDYSVYKDLKFIDSTRLPNEPNYFGWKHFTVIRAVYDDRKPDSNGIWIVEEVLKPADPDTTGAYFYLSRRNKEYHSNNARYQLIVKGDTVRNFTAFSSLLPSYPINQTRSWEEGYSFLFQRQDGEGENGRWITSIHAVVNGEDLNECGYDNTLAPVFLDEKLFFLFQKDGKWGWNYNGEEHPNIWDRVYYHYGDGESGPAPDPTWKNICALKDGMWYMVRFERTRSER